MAEQNSLLLKEHEFVNACVANLDRLEEEERSSSEKLKNELNTVEANLENGLQEAVDEPLDALQVMHKNILKKASITGQLFTRGLYPTLGY